MGKFLEPGTLVQVREIGFRVGSRDIELINTDGKLWVIRGVVDRTHDPKLTLYRCAALATGTEYLWYGFEIETQEQINETET